VNERLITSKPKLLPSQGGEILNHTFRIKTIGIILAGLIALLALMTVAMSPSAFGDEDRVITLERDTGYSDEGIRLKITIYEGQEDGEAESSEIEDTHCEYRQTGSFFTPCLEEI